MKEILKTENLIFKDIIKYPDIGIEAGRTTFLCGPSGCGKSTLLKMFNKTVSPDGGSIYYNGENTECIDSVALRRKVLLAGQSVYLFSGTVEDNFRMYYDYRGQTPPGPEIIKKFLSVCCADFPLDAGCDSMSGGERQRIYTAIIMSFQPEVLMLDEPSSALDHALADSFIGNIKQFCSEKGMTLIIVSHDSALAGKYADYVIRLGA